MTARAGIVSKPMLPLVRWSDTGRRSQGYREKRHRLIKGLRKLTFSGEERRTTIFGRVRGIRIGEGHKRTR